MDALRQYQARRNFAVTPEPSDGGYRPGHSLAFVVQKHWASSLHYDFRLEFGGTLKSWAVPKGPSLDPKDKRMAVQVEDHPLAYAGFEGSIPAGQYGAGKVIVWDQGSWVPQGTPDQGYRDGRLKFELRGHKLHGKWALVRTKPKNGKQAAWLLIKERDPFARPGAEFSVVDAMPDSVKPIGAPKTQPALPPEASRAALPLTLAPQFATLVQAPPPDARNWVFEIKFDGYRILTRVDGKQIQLFTRNGNDWTSKLRPLHQELVALKLPPGWYDGEIVLPGPDGRPDFGALQAAFDCGRTRSMVLYLFDMPFFNGRDLREVPLDARRALLQQTLASVSSQQVRFSEAFDADPHALIASACKLGLEGLIAKRRDSPYVSRRSADWVKLKCQQRQEFVIGGYTDPQGARPGIGSLLLGVFDAIGALQYAGNVGTGFNQTSLQEIRRKLAAIEAKASPFAAATRITGKPHWVKPELVAEVSFGEWTRGGRIRHPVFRGLRDDTAATTITREKAMPSAPGTASKEAHKPASPQHPPGLPPRMRVTHPQRVIDPRSGTTKIELLRYYDLVGELMMEHLKGRPVALVRAPAGVQGELFFQKHAEAEKMPGVRALDPALDISHPAMLEVASKQGLLSAAQWNVVEFHTLNTSTRSFEHPDRMVFDLDPGEGVAWKQVQEAAELVHGFLSRLGLASFLKTSGGKGLHIVVPLRPIHDWDAVKGFSQAIVAHLAATLAQRFAAKSGPKNRVGKIFIDYLRNGLGATTVCAWSARARPGLGISVPVAWDELAELRGGDHWTVRTVHGRLDSGNVAWKGYKRAARSLTAAMKVLGYSGP